jgi:hypothetical protein
VSVLCNQLSSSGTGDERFIGMSCASAHIVDVLPLFFKIPDENRRSVSPLVNFVLR